MEKNRRWICADVWMDIFPHFDRPQLGLKMALLSPRFEVLVDKHFECTSELPIWRPNIICNYILEELPKMRVFIGANSVEFPLPDRPLPNKIRFENLRIDYIDHFVITFLRANQQIFDKGINLELHMPFPYNTKDVQPIWNVFTREIWPILAPNIRHLNFAYGHDLEILRRHISPTVLTDFNIISIRSDDLLPDSIADDGPNATAGQALSKWLHTPRSDGKPKQLRWCYYVLKSETTGWVNSFKEAFLRATTSSAANYIFRLDRNLFESMSFVPFELMNERTNELLTLKKKEKGDDANMDEEDDDDDWEERWVMKRCRFGQTATVKWEDEKTNKLNNVNVSLNEFSSFGPLSPPKAGKMNAKIL